MGLVLGASRAVTTRVLNVQVLRVLNVQVLPQSVKRAVMKAPSSCCGFFFVCGKGSFVSEPAIDPQSLSRRFLGKERDQGSMAGPETNDPYGQSKTISRSH